MSLSIFTTKAVSIAHVAPNDLLIVEHKDGSKEAYNIGPFVVEMSKKGFETLYQALGEVVFKTYQGQAPMDVVFQILMDRNAYKETDA